MIICGVVLPYMVEWFWRRSLAADMVADWRSQLSLLSAQLLGRRINTDAATRATRASSPTAKRPNAGGTGVLFLFWAWLHCLCDFLDRLDA